MSRSPALGFPEPESVLQRKLTLSELLDAPTFAEVVRSFVELHHIGLQVLDEQGARLADVRSGDEGLCRGICSSPEGARSCRAVLSGLKDELLAADGFTTPAPLSRACFSGLRYLVMPVLWEGDALGRVILGPFLPEDLALLPASLSGSGLEAAVRRASEAELAPLVRHFRQLLEALLAAGQKTILTCEVHLEASHDSNRKLEAQNQKLAAMNARLQELDRLKSAFLATVSHELRTPLTSIIGYSEMLAEGLAGPMSREQIDYVRTILEKGETLLRLISTILDLSQVEAGKMRLQFEQLEVAEVLQTALTSVTPQAGRRGITLELKLPQARQRAVAADRERLRQVVVNLLANAVKFTPQGGKVLLSLSEVAHQPELAAEGYCIVTEDSGTGIPRDEFEKIFDSFYQVDSSSTREFGGAGLGLAIVKSFVEGHGGVIRVSSELGRGSRFTAILPASPPSPGRVAPPPLPGPGAVERF